MNCVHCSQMWVNSLGEIAFHLTRIYAGPSRTQMKDCMTNLKKVLCSRLRRKGMEILWNPFLSNCILRLHCSQTAPALLCSELHKPFSQVGIVLLQITNHVRLFFQDFVQVIIVPKRWNLNQSVSTQGCHERRIRDDRKSVQKVSFPSLKITDNWTRPAIMQRLSVTNSVVLKQLQSCLLLFAFCERYN